MKLFCSCRGKRLQFWQNFIDSFRLLNALNVLGIITFTVLYLVHRCIETVYTCFFKHHLLNYFQLITKLNLSVYCFGKFHIIFVVYSKSPQRKKHNTNGKQVPFRNITLFVHKTWGRIKLRIYFCHPNNRLLGVLL